MPFAQGAEPNLVARPVRNLPGSCHCPRKFLPEHEIDCGCIPPADRAFPAAGPGPRIL